MKEEIKVSLEESENLYPIESHTNSQGSLSVIDFTDESLPFVPQRIFYIYGVDQVSTRGKHAHKKCKQLFVQLSGSCTLTFANRGGTGNYLLNNPSEGFLANELTWCEISEFSEGSVLMVLASHSYDSDDYIHDFEAFKVQIGGNDDSRF